MTILQRKIRTFDAWGGLYVTRDGGGSAIVRSRNVMDDGLVPDKDA